MLAKQHAAQLTRTKLAKQHAARRTRAMLAKQHAYTPHACSTRSTSARALVCAIVTSWHWQKRMNSSHCHALQVHIDLLQSKGAIQFAQQQIKSLLQ